MTRLLQLFLLLVMGLSCTVTARSPWNWNFLVLLSQENDVSVYNAKGEVLARLADALKDEPRIIHVKDLQGHEFSLILQSLHLPCFDHEAPNLNDLAKDDTNLNKDPSYTTVDHRAYLNAPDNGIPFKTSFFLNGKTTTPLARDPRPPALVKFLRDKLDDTNEPTYESTVHLRGPWPVAQYGPTDGVNRDLNKRATSTDYHYKVNSFAGSSVS